MSPSWCIPPRLARPAPSKEMMTVASRASSVYIPQKFREPGMELLLRRDQQGGLMGGVKFQLTAKAKLTDDESAAIKKYKMGDTILYEKPTDGPDPRSFMSLAKHRFMVPRIQV